ncbi:tetratricopeptide repeat protein [Flavisphingomonas formosensis]|uniref:tetratricopeptide repeat protein n=1 Tax=Flavisphingomonas formosensis TaxID=861534 RepID=UPI0012FA4FA4|nr:tetratricopeptide repeat protein [Sphingomonas formosensis]
MRIRLVFAWVILALSAMPQSAQADGRADSMALFRKAYGRFKAGDVPAARVVLLNAIKADPHNAIAHVLQGRVYLALKDGVAAEAEFGRARDSGIAADDIRHLMANAYLLQDRPQDAIDEADPSHVPGRFAVWAARVRAMAQLSLDNDDAATAELNLALRLSPRNSAVWTDIGHFRIENGETAGAVDAADRAVALDPRNVEALLLKGQLVRTQYGLTAALPWFDRMLAIDPNNLDALLEKAATLGDIGRSRAMLATTRQVLAIRPGNPMAFYLQAVLAARARNWTLARSLLQRTDGKLDDLPATLLLAGAIEYQTGNYEQAIDKLARLVGMQPENMKARRLMGAAQWRQGDDASAIDTLRPIADRPDADTYTLTIVGRALERQGQRKDAALYLDRAAIPTRAEPSPLDVVADPRQLAALRAAAVANPGDTKTQIALIAALLRADQGAEALDVSQALLARNRGAPMAHVLVGDAYVATGNYAAAATAYRDAANISFTEPVALRLIDALRRAGNSAGAVEVLNLFLSQNPQDVPAQLLAADVMLSNGQWDKAINILESLRGRLGDRDAALLNNLAWAYFSAVRMDQALVYAGKAYDLAPANPAVGDTYGWILFQTGRDRQKGLALLRKAAGQSPRDAGVRWHLAQAYAATGAGAQAKAAAQAALALPGFQDRAKAEALIARY